MCLFFSGWELTTCLSKREMCVIPSPIAWEYLAWCFTRLWTIIHSILLLCPTWTEKPLGTSSSYILYFCTTVGLHQALLSYNCQMSPIMRFPTIGLHRDPICFPLEQPFIGFERHWYITVFFSKKTHFTNFEWHWSMHQCHSKMMKRLSEWKQSWFTVRRFCWISHYGTQSITVLDMNWLSILEVFFPCYSKLLQFAFIAM